jgi:copper homeostasis protein
VSILEICVDSVEAALAADAGGAQRLELCSALMQGGLTPSLGLMRVVRAHFKGSVHVMIRPRGGDFLYSQNELSVMSEDITLAADCGIDGVVFGLLTAEADVDVEGTRRLVELARPMEVTFHRAIDMTRDLRAALEDVVCTGADRVLTSGGEPDAHSGRHRIRDLVRASNGRIRIMAGGGVRASNAAEIAHASGVREFHASLRQTIPSPVKHQVRKVHLGDAGVDNYVRSSVLVEDVRALREAIVAANRDDKPGVV